MSFVPEDFVVPRVLATEAFRLEPLGPEHNEGDYQAWTSSISHIRATPGFEGRPWPTPDMTPAENLGDLEQHAADFAGAFGVHVHGAGFGQRRDYRVRVYLSVG